MKRLLCLLWIFLVIPTLGVSYQPFHSPVALVAGEGETGYQNGAFWQARFDGISSMLIDVNLQQLYIADYNNKALRQVDLGNNNDVTTVVKSVGKGSVDGAFGTARFGCPGQMIWGKPNHTIFFSDQTNHQIKKIDLVEKTVSTVYDGSKQAHPKNQHETLNTPAGMVYIPEKNWLLIADKRQLSVKLLDLSTGKLSLVFRHSDMLDIKFIILDRDNHRLLFSGEYKPGFFMITRKDQPDRDKRINRKPKEYTEDLNKFLEGLAKGQQFLLHRPYQVLGQHINAVVPTKTGLYYSIVRKDRGNKQAALYVLENDRSREIDIHNWVPVIPQSIWPAYKTTEQQTLQKNQLFLNAKALAIDHQNKRFFIADQGTERIIKLKFPDPHHTLPKEYQYSLTKSKNRKRIMLLGNSINFMVADMIGEKEKWKQNYYSLSKRMEYWLNLNNFLKDKPETIDVIYIGDLISKRSPLTNAFVNIEALETYQPELIVYNYTYWDLVYDALEYLRKPPEGKHLYLDEDVEFKMTPISRRQMHPFGNELYHYIKNNKSLIGDFATINRNRVTYNNEYMIEMLKQSRNARLFFKLSFSRIERMQKIIATYNQENNKSARLILNLVPLGCQMSKQEISDHSRQGVKFQSHFLKHQFEFECKKRGIILNDYIDRIRIVSPSLFPLLNIPENDHYSKKAADLIGYVISRDIEKELNLAK